MKDFFAEKMKWLGICLPAFFVLTACGDDEHAETTNTSYFAHGVVELPALRNSANDLLVKHSASYNGKNVTSYTMEYDKSKKHARWVAFRFDVNTIAKNVDRKDDKDPFEADPNIPIEYQRVRGDFGQKGYDRGHICASADRLYSRASNDHTFYYSNMSPQINAFNAHIWAKLESQVRTWAYSCTSSDTLYVVKGGTIDKPEHVLRYIDNDQTKPVPKYYYMALFFKKADSFKAIAFWMEHANIATSTPLLEFAISVDELERRTGIDFFPALNDKLENAVEAKFNVAAWPGLK